LDSLEKEYWLPEEDYELVERFPGARISRLGHQQQQQQKQQEREQQKQQQQLEAGCCEVVPLKRNPFEKVKVFLNGILSPSKQDLQKLIRLCGAEIVSAYDECDICLSGKNASSPGSKGKSPMLSERYFLDCLHQYSILYPEETKHYYLQKVESNGCF